PPSKTYTKKKAPKWGATDLLRCNAILFLQLHQQLLRPPLDLRIVAHLRHPLKRRLREAPESLDRLHRRVALGRHRRGPLHQQTYFRILLDWPQLRTANMPVVDLHQKRGPNRLIAVVLHREFSISARLKRHRQLKIPHATIEEKFLEIGLVDQLVLDRHHRRI